MKKLLIVITLLVPGVSNAGLLDISGAGDLVAQAVKVAKIGTTIDLNGKVSYANYLGFKPQWNGKPLADYLEIGLGGSIAKDEPFKFLLAPTVNIKPLVDKVLLSPVTLPDIWLGPSVSTPVYGEAWSWKTHIKMIVSIGLGK